MVGHGTKFPRKKEEAIAALIVHGNVEQSARAVGIGVNTLLRWLKLPEFVIEYREARRAAYGQSTARLQHFASAAVTTLFKVMADPATPPAVRVRAADIILARGADGIAIEDFDARLTEAERAVLLKSTRTI
jgi:hypothetical protein